MKRMLLLLVGCLLTSWSFAADYLTWLDPGTGITWNYYQYPQVTLGKIILGYGTSSHIPKGGWGACSNVSRSEIVIPAKVAGMPVASIEVGWGTWCTALSDNLLVENVKKVIVSEGIARIEAYAFTGSTALESVQLPSSLEFIGAKCLTSNNTMGAFRDCTSLKEVTFGENMQRLVIEDYAFAGCTNLTTLKNVTDRVTFSYLYSANRSFYDSKLTVYDYGYYDSAKMEALLGVRAGTSSENAIILNTFALPKGVRFICGGVFKDSDIKSITLPEGLEGIGENAFANCTGLTEVKLPKSLKRLGDGVFDGCTSIPSSGTGEQYESSDKQVLINGSYASNVTIPNTVRFIHSDAFSNRTNLTSVTIPSSVTTIGTSAFEGCTGLTSVTILEGVTSIPDYAFRNCSSLTSVTIPSSVTSIGRYAFEGCKSLTSVHISDLATWCKIKFLTSLSNPLVYAKKLYLNGNLVDELNIPSSVTSIRNYTFQNCSSLTSVTIPSSVTSIGMSAFAGCSNLTSVSIPSSVTTIGSYAFYNCTNLTSVTIPSSVTSIGYEAFRGCSGLTSVTIPEGVTSIRDGTFLECSSLTSVTIPSNVTTIGAKAFEGCSNLGEVIFKGNPPTASSDSFILCDGYYPSTKATEWSKVIESGLWNNLRMISYQLVNITFDANGGTGGTSDSYVVGMSLQAPTVSREGYTFKGWSPSVPSVVPEVDTTYTAQWQVNQYRMTFNANGGTGGKTLTQDYGSRVTAPTVTREGYTFNGWSPEVPSTMPATNTSYTAQWRVNRYTMTFDANGGEGGTRVTQDYGSTLIAPTVTRDGCYTFVGWLPEVPKTVPAENVTYVAQWEIQAPSWETPDNYQNNMTIYAQVKDTTKDALIESEGSLLAAFDGNGQCRGVASITTGPTGKLYQLTVCSNTAAGEALTLRIWNASTGETIDIGESVAFVSDGKIGSLPAPKVYTVGQIALDVQLKTGWNWFSVNVELPSGTTLSEVFKDWTPCDEDVIKSATSTATYYDGVWYPEDFALEPGKMYQIKNSVTDPVTIRLMGAPIPSTTEIAVKAGWNWLGYTGTSAVDVATAFSADAVFTDEDLLKSGTASATYYCGQWWGDLKLEPGKGYKLQVANATTVKYAGATSAAASVALLSVGANPNWVADERQYNMTVYASVKDAAGHAFEAAGSWLGAFDTNGICHGAVALGNGPRGKLYQLTPGSDTASGEVFTLKLWDATSGQIYDIEQTITFVSDGTVGSIINPQVYTVVETAVKFDVVANVIGDGTVTGAGAYEAGETVTLMATPAEGSVFCGWSTTPVSMEATHSFTMPEEAVTLTAYFAPVAALNNYVAGQGFVSADEVDAKIQAYIAENNLKTPEEVEAAIEAHVASNGLLTPTQANQQTQDYIVANKLKSEQEVAVAIAQAIEEYVSSNGLLTPAEAEQLVEDYIADNNLMSKDEAKQELLDADEVFTADEMKEMAFDTPVVEVKDDVIEIAISLQTAESLDAWQAMALQGAALEIDAQKGQVRVKVPKGDKKAAFYKFVVPNEQ